MPNDLLVPLYKLPEAVKMSELVKDPAVRIVRALAVDRSRVERFVRENFHEGWVNECLAAFSNSPVTCFIAIKNKAVVGFACYDVTAKDFFGPTGVSETERGTGIGKALLVKCLLSMREEGYGYAVIGWSDTATPFYKKTVGAIEIPDSFPGVFASLVEMDVPEN